MIQNDATFNEQQFYTVDTKTGKNHGSVIIDPYDEAAQEVHDNLIRACIEAGGDLREARGLLARAIDQLYLLGYDSGFTNPAIEQLITDIKFYLHGGKV